MTAASRQATVLVLAIGLTAGLVGVRVVGNRPKPPIMMVRRVALRPPIAPGLVEAPAEVREFVNRVLEQVPEGGEGASGYQFHHWKWKDQPTHEMIGLKAIAATDPDALIARVMDVDGYKGQIPHVDVSRSQRDPAFKPPSKVRAYQIIRVPRVARVQQELVLVDAGTIKGYRVAYWYLLDRETRSLNPKIAARSASNVGAWIASPNSVGYAVSSWPERGDVNAVQWITLTSGENAFARTIVEGNIDSMARWAKSKN